MSPLQFYRSLRAALPRAPRWCLALVVHTQGSTPRKSGALMAVQADDRGIHTVIGSIGGGLAEARVLAAAQALLLHSPDAPITSELVIDLAGNTTHAAAEFSGICGGRMRIVLQCPEPERLAQHCDALIAALSAGVDVRLAPTELVVLPASAPGRDEILLRAHPQVYIGGGGHCGVALATVLTQVGFPVALVDDRAQIIGCEPPFEVQRFSNWSEALSSSTGKAPIAVLLSRNYQQDLLALDAIASVAAPFGYIGMMGSARRIRLVLAERPNLPRAVADILRAPLGLSIGAETPMEIAISIAAELIQHTNLGHQPAPL